MTIITMAFRECNNPAFQSIVIPSGVTSIPDFCFYGCNQLLSVTFEGNITSFGDDAFFNCNQLIEFIFKSNSFPSANNPNATAPGTFGNVTATGATGGTIYVKPTATANALT